MPESTERIAAWPMYGVDPTAVAAFWTRLAARLRADGVVGVPAALARPVDLAAHWRDPDLLLSQTCGYPFAFSLRDIVRYVATPRFSAPGCDGARYSSAVVVRHGDPAARITDLRGRRVAYNSRDSHSGYNALRALVAPHAEAGRFFHAAIETGSHRGSLAAVKGERADVAAVDAVTLALVRRADAGEVEGLRVLGYTALAPGLPLITSRLTSDRDLDALRAALAATCGANEPTSGPLLLDGVDVLPIDAYRAIDATEAEAVARGYAVLR